MWGELSSEWGELSSECGASCLGASFLWGELSWGELSLGRVVRNPSACSLLLLLNLNSLLVKRQTDNPSPGAATGGNWSLALTREVNLDTLSSDSSEEEIRDSGRSFQSLIVWGKNLLTIFALIRWFPVY